MRERVLITGASGFVGYHLIQEALKNNLEVFAAVRKSSDITHLKGLNINYTHLDFNDVLALRQDIETNRYSYIIHAAGMTSAPNLATYNKVNAEFSVNLANAAAASGRIKRFVFMSSLAALGPLHTQTGIIENDSIPHPVTAYGKSKLLAEQKLNQIAKLDITTLRPTAVYGPRDKGIYIILKQFAKGIEPYIGRAPQKLSFVYVKDLAAVCIRALYNGKNKAYNISDGNFYSRYELGELSRHILRNKTMKIHLSVKFVKFIASVSEFMGSLRGKTPPLNKEKLHELMAANWTCSIEEAKHDLGYYPRYDLEAGLNETLTWYRSNKWL